MLLWYLICKWFWCIVNLSNNNNQNISVQCLVSKLSLTTVRSMKYNCPKMLLISRQLWLHRLRQKTKVNLSKIAIHRSTHRKKAQIRLRQLHSLWILQRNGPTILGNCFDLIVRWIFSFERWCFCRTPVTFKRYKSCSNLDTLFEHPVEEEEVNNKFTSANKNKSVDCVGSVDMELDANLSANISIDNGVNTSKK